MDEGGDNPHLNYNMIYRVKLNSNSHFKIISKTNLIIVVRPIKPLINRSLLDHSQMFNPINFMLNMLSLQHKVYVRDSTHRLVADSIKLYN